MLVLVGFRAASRLFCVEAKYLSASRLFCVMVARRLLCVVAKHLSAYRLFCVMIAHRLFCVKAKHLSASRLFCVMIASRLFCVKGQLPLRLSIVLGEGQQSPFFASCSLTTNFFRNRLSLFFFFQEPGGIFFSCASLVFFWEAVTLLCLQTISRCPTQPPNTFFHNRITLAFCLTSSSFKKKKELTDLSVRVCIASQIGTAQGEAYFNHSDRLARGWLGDLVDDAIVNSG